MATITQKGEIEISKLKSRQPKRLPMAIFLLGSLAFLGILCSLWMAFYYAPTDAVQGPPQRIFYLHVPMAWIGMLSFVVLTFCGIIYLWKRDERWDWVAQASAEIG